MTRILESAPPFLNPQEVIVEYELDIPEMVRIEKWKYTFNLKIRFSFSNVAASIDREQLWKHYDLLIFQKTNWLTAIFGGITPGIQARKFQKQCVTHRIGLELLEGVYRVAPIYRL